MEHAIAQLEISLNVVETNEPINRANGNIEQADYERQCAKDFREAIETLKNTTKTNMQPHQQRVVTEKDELDDKIFALESFIAGSDIFKSLDSDERERLVRQCSCMNEYSEILQERIEAFKN